MQKQVYVVSTGVSGNLGDAVIRRRVLAWVEGLGQRHVYVGNTTPGWLEQLQLPGEDEIYPASRRRAWLRGLLWGRGRVLVFDPGEVPLGKAHLKSEIVFLVMCAWLRVMGGTVVRPPRAVAHYHWATGTAHRWGCRLSQTTLWRDRPSLERMRCGKLVPDTAFAEPEGPHSDQARNLLVLSLRAARDKPDSAWFDAIRRFARDRDLQVLAVSQVDEDESRTADLAEELEDVGARFVPWGDDGDLAREQRVRALYARSAVVVSDRLHVLLLAAKAGAVPLEIVPRPAPKVATHFATAGIDDISLACAGLDAHEITTWAEQQISRGPAIAAALRAAEARLTTEVAAVRSSVTPPVAR